MRCQGSGAGTTGAARSLLRIACWYAESSGSQSGCSTRDSFFVRFLTQP